MNIQILKGPAYAAAKIDLAEREEITSEAGSMIAMSDNIMVETTTHKKGTGSVMGALKRVVSGESFFLNHYRAAGQAGHLYLSAALPGDMTVIELSQENLVVEGGSFVAAEAGIETDVGWHGFKSMLSGEGLFWLHLAGSGQVILNSFGCIYEVDVQDEYIVDTGHIVAFQESLNFSISKAGQSWLGSFLGGEGLVCRFQGQGKLWCQSHNPPEFGRILGPMLRPR